MARARVERAATDAGLEARSASPGAVVETLRAAPPGMLILDLDAGGTGVIDELVAARRAGIAPERVVGFFSHVDEELGARARAAGCEALPRGRFWRTLPELLRDDDRDG